MTTYQDVVAANLAQNAWSLPEAAGLDFAPYIGTQHLTGLGAMLYQQAGPFAASFGLKVPVGGYLRSNSTPLFVGPFYWEAWIKLDAVPPAFNEPVLYWGTYAVDGGGLLIEASPGRVRMIGGNPAFNIDTGRVFPAGWHLLQVGANQANTGTVAALDGQLIGASVSPISSLATNIIGFVPTGASTANVAVSIAMPALYHLPLTPNAAFSTWLAATDPATALGYSATYGGALSNAKLDAILAAVRKTFP